MSGKMMLDDDLLDKVGGGIEGSPEEEQQNESRNAAVQAITIDGAPATFTFTANPSDGPQKMTVYHYQNGAWQVEQENQGPTIKVSPLDQ